MTDKTNLYRRRNIREEEEPSIEEILEEDELLNGNDDQESEKDNRVSKNESIDITSPMYLDPITFDDIIGFDEIKGILKENLGFILDPTPYLKLGAKPPKGILLYGTAGIGKTMLASAFINESKLHPYIVKRHGTSDAFAFYLENVFKKARDNAPSIILLDDLDKFSKDKEMNDPIFNNLQSLIDSVRNEEVYLIATANKIRNFPASLLRDGRFDTRILLDCPSDKDSILLVKKFLAEKKVDSNVNIEDIISMRHFCSTPIAIKTAINKACIIAAHKKKDVVETIDFVEECVGNRFDGQNFKKSKNFEEICFHEAGHILVSEAIEEDTIGFSSSIYGSKSEEGITVHKKGKVTVIQNVLTSLAGKASVDLNLPIIPTGCESDLKAARWGLKDAITEGGLMGYSLLREGNSNPVIELDIANAINEKLWYYDKVVKNLLIQNRELLLSFVKEMSEKGYLLNSDIRRLESLHPINRSAIQGII